MTVSTRSRRAGVAGVLAALGVGVGFAVTVPVSGAAGGPSVPRPQKSHLTVHLTAQHSRFTPASVKVPPGTTVRFVIRNLDPIDHELIVGGPEVQARHEAGRDAGHLGQEPGAVSVAAGTTATTTWTAPQVLGPVTFACHLPGHFAYGMVGVVNVATNVTTRS